MPNLLLYGKKMKKLCRFWYDSKKKCIFAVAAACCVVAKWCCKLAPYNYWIYDRTDKYTKHDGKCVERIRPLERRVAAQTRN